LTRFATADRVLAIEGAPAAGKTTLIAQTRRQGDVVVPEPLAGRLPPPWRQEVPTERALADLWFLHRERVRWAQSQRATGRVLFDRCILSQLVHWVVRHRVCGLTTAPAVLRALRHDASRGDVALPRILLLHPSDAEWTRRADGRRAAGDAGFDPEPMFRTDDFLFEVRAVYATLVGACRERTVVARQELSVMPSTTIEELASRLRIEECAG
jgi:predicted ATPase